ncbi:MAG: FAD-dependent monooxygenase [Lachnospiraceae bacterium]|nr:FAD-dependent monooxygenase [Lachnospiraceae bacterium]
MIKIDSLKISAKKNIDIKNFIVTQYRIKSVIKDFKILKKSVDAREKENIMFIYSVILSLDENEEKALIKRNKNVVSYEEKEYEYLSEEFLGRLKNSGRSSKCRILVVGMGPAGLFSSILLSEAGFDVTLIDRGKAVEDRINDVEKFWNTGKLDTSSNVQFGEGGAGTFSDGKLNTGVKDSDGRKDFILNTFVKNGAKENILYDSKPHIGTDDLRLVVTNIRKKLLENGVKILFSTKFTDIKEKGGKVTGAVLENVLNGQESVMECDKIILAIGHSSRDTFEKLYPRLDMCVKPFAMGFRVIHTQDFINRSQYGESYEDIYENLESSSYKLTYQGEERGVYTFCMCPGGYVVNASSEKNMLCVNGMSDNKRDSGYANSAVIVQIKESDLDPEDVFSGMKLQRRIEENTYKAGNGKIPVSTFENFVKDTDYESDIIFDENTTDADKAIKGEYTYTDISSIYPPFVNKDFADALLYYDRKIKNYAKSNPLIAASETRSSSPVKIIRDDNLEGSIKGIYPCGEGAGYAGGIVSAAMDGMKVAKKIIESLQDEIS